MPLVVARIGIDLNPIHGADPDETLWLQALVWPEHQDRAALLQSALNVVQHYPPTLLTGDALEVLPAVVASFSKEVALCVFHTNTLGHFPAEARARFQRLVPELASGRDLFWLSNEGPSTSYPLLRLIHLRDGKGDEQRLALHHPHGAWLEWRAGRTGSV